MLLQEVQGACRAGLCITHGDSTAVPRQHVQEMGTALISPGELTVGHHSLHTGRSVRVSQAGQLLSPFPALFLSLQCLRSPLGAFPTWILLPIKEPRSL